MASASELYFSERQPAAPGARGLSNLETGDSNTAGRGERLASTQLYDDAYSGGDMVKACSSCGHSRPYQMYGAGWQGMAPQLYGNMAPQFYGGPWNQQPFGDPLAQQIYGNQWNQPYYGNGFGPQIYGNQWNQPYYGMGGGGYYGGYGCNGFGAHPFRNALTGMLGSLPYMIGGYGGYGGNMLRMGMGSLLFSLPFLIGRGGFRHH